MSHQIPGEHRQAMFQDEHFFLNIDALPIPCSVFDHEFKIVDVNTEAVKLFEAKSKKHFLVNFERFFPLHQADNSSSAEKGRDYIMQAVEKGQVSFEWMHRTDSGKELPVSVILVRVEFRGKPIVIAYLNDQRQLKESMNQKHQADQRAQIMLNTTPLCCNFWDDELNNIDCNQEAVKLFGLDSKQDYLERFFELSPEYQPDGYLSSERAAEMVQTAFKNDKIIFEWMHQTLSGELIPTEITLIRVDYGGKNVVLGYTKDLREIKTTYSMLKQFEHFAFTDNLTSAYNRRYFFDTTEEVLTRLSPSNQPISLIMFDFDHFKRINDTYGHAMGDEVLKSSTAAIKNILRADDLLARYGGDEFLVLLKNTNELAAEKIAAKIRKAVSDLSFHLNGEPVYVTISLGVHTMKAGTKNLQQAMAVIDSALYQAKHSGRNAIVIS